MNKFFLLLIMPILLSAGPVRFTSASEKTDIFSELKNNTQTHKERTKTIEKIKNMKEISGLEWFQMSIGEKQDHLLASMYILERRGVRFARSLGDYSYLIQQKLYVGQGLYGAKLTDILSLVVYEEEPEAREVLDKMRIKPEIKKIEMH